MMNDSIYQPQINVLTSELRELKCKHSNLQEKLSDLEYQLFFTKFAILFLAVTLAGIVANL